jgi:hypothetical protein
MFKLAVLGPIVTGGLGVARQCMDCYRWRPSYDGAPCFGFGPGCMEYRPQLRDRNAASPSVRAPEPPRR